MASSKKYPWILVALLFGVALLNYMDRQMIATMRPAMQMDIAELKQATNFGRLMAVFLWVYRPRLWALFQVRPFPCFGMD
jgi:hypothetical protein